VPHIEYGFEALSKGKKDHDFLGFFHKHKIVCVSAKSLMWIMTLKPLSGNKHQILNYLLGRWIVGGTSSFSTAELSETNAV